MNTKKAAYNILPGTEEILTTMGEQIKLARLRRSLSADPVAAAGVDSELLTKVLQSPELLALLKALGHLK